jgi:hypothetical protein
MKPIFLFFLSLCFLSAGLSNHAFGDVLASKVPYAQVQHTKNADQVGVENRSQHHNLIKGAGLSADETSLISDEDDDNTSARRYLVPVKYALILSYAIVLSFLSSCRKQPLPICSHLSYTGGYKYILQRALRI